METDDEECPNLILVHSGGYEFIYAGDGNPMNCCCMQSSVMQRGNDFSPLANASSLAAWTDLGRRGLRGSLPEAQVAIEPLVRII